MIRTLLLLAISLLASSAMAQNIVDWGEVVPGEVYSYKYMTPVQGYYTPQESGTMRCYIAGDVVHVYEDAAHESIIQHSNQYYGSSGEKVLTYTVEKGKTVYFYNAFPMDSGTFSFAVGKEEITLQDVSPSVKTPYLSISSNYRASITFNIPVKCTKCVLAVNGESFEITPEIFDASIVLNWFATLRQLYREGKISAGDVLTITITGIRDVNDSLNRPDFGDGSGKLVLSYTMAGAPAELIRRSGTPDSGVSEMKTYYLPDSDEGLVKLTFSSDLDPNCRPEAELQYGDQDNIELGMYFERLPVSIEGATLTVDLRGVRRSPDEMVPGLDPLPTIALRVSNIKSADGQYVLTGSMASPYSFGYSYFLRSVLYRVAADWVPVSGSPLVAGTEMEIWVLNGKQISFDSVDFSYLKDGVDAKVSIPYSELRVENDAYEPDALLFYLSAPAIDADPDSEINVTFGGLKCADGLDHSSDIFVRYKSDTSGVEGIDAVDADAVYYDLAGRRVFNPSKGIYIRNGKKIVK